MRRAWPSSSIRPSRITTVMSRAAGAPVPSTTATWVIAMTGWLYLIGPPGGGCWARTGVAENRNAKSRVSQARISSILPVTLVRSHEGAGHVRDRIVLGAIMGDTTDEGHAPRDPVTGPPPDHRLAGRGRAQIVHPDVERGRRPAGAELHPDREAC